MEKQRQTAGFRRQSDDVAEELDDINARTTQRGPDRVRRKIETTIEGKARKRRSRETPASSAWKK